MRFPTTARWICGGIAVAALATFGIDTMAEKSVAKALAAERNAARRDGIPVFLSDLAKPLPPADQNAAVLYESLPAYNSEDAKNKAEGELYSRLVKSPTTLSVADWAAVRKTGAENAPRLRALHEALNRPTCVFHHDYQTNHPEDILLPELAKMRNCARQLSMESLLMAHDGKGVAAVANARLGFRLANHTMADPLLIGYLVAVAIDNVTANAMQKILLLNPNSAPTADAVRAAMDNAPRRSMRPALSGEIAFEQTMCETLRHEGAAGLQKFFVTGDGRTNAVPQILSVGIALRGSYWNRIIDKNALTMLRFNRTMMSACDQPYREGQAVALRAQASLQSTRNPEDLLAAIVLPVETNQLSKRAVTENKIAVTEAAAAVLAYRDAHGGTSPTSLEQAMSAPPTNAFDNIPLVYQVVENGFIIGASDPADPMNKSTVTSFTLPAKQ